MAVRGLNATPEELTRFTDFLRSQSELPYTKTKLGKLLNKRFPHYSVQQYRKSQFVSDFLQELIANPPVIAEPQTPKAQAERLKVEKQLHTETEFVQDGNSATFKGTYVQGQFDSIEAYLESKQVDLNKWKVGKVKVKTYQGYIKNKDEEIETVTLNSFEANLETNTGFDIEKARQGVIAAMQAYAPVYRSFKRQPIAGGHLLTTDPADSHFGKLAHFYSTGDTYTLDIAQQRTIDGFEGLLNKAQGFPVDRILLILGNDMLHVDNTIRTTTAGTKQDTDGMWYEAFMCAKKTFVGVIEGLACVADVDVIFNPSNHDYQSGWMLFDSIASWFHKSKNITFNGDLRHRKYYQYHSSLIGTTHGNGVKNVNLMHYMANEAPQLWAQTKYRYWYTHHIHHLDKLKYQSGKDYVGGTVQSLRSISGTDVYHDQNGYNGVPKALEAFVHSKQHGQVAQLTHVF